MIKGNKMTNIKQHKIKKEELIQPVNSPPFHKVVINGNTKLHYRVVNMYSMEQYSVDTNWFICVA